MGSPPESPELWSEKWALNGTKIVSDLGVHFKPDLLAPWPSISNDRDSVLRTFVSTPYHCLNFWFQLGLFTSTVRLSEVMRIAHRP